MSDCRLRARQPLMLRFRTVGRRSIASYWNLRPIDVSHTVFHFIAGADGLLSWSIISQCSYETIKYLFDYENSTGIYYISIPSLFAKHRPYCTEWPQTMPSPTANNKICQCLSILFHVIDAGISIFKREDLFLRRNARQIIIPRSMAKNTKHISNLFGGN